jgi:hypothetical protein
MRDPTVAARPATDLPVKYTDLLVEYAQHRLKFLLQSAEILEEYMRSLEGADGCAFDPRDVVTRMLECRSARAIGPLLQKKKRGRGPRYKALRDDAIVSIVSELVEKFDLRPTRTHGRRRQEKPSACSIVQAALAQFGLHLDERSVEGIWDRSRRSVSL